MHHFLKSFTALRSGMPVLPDTRQLHAPPYITAGTHARPSSNLPFAGGSNVIAPSTLCHGLAALTTLLAVQKAAHAAAEERCPSIQAQSKPILSSHPVHLCAPPTCPASKNFFCAAGHPLSSLSTVHTCVHHTVQIRQYTSSSTYQAVHTRQYTPGNTHQAVHTRQYTPNTNCQSTHRAHLAYHIITYHHIICWQQFTPANTFTHQHTLVAHHASTQTMTHIKTHPR
jgi:hypothetical protein